jgi:hypothetical protein
MTDALPCGDIRANTRTYSAAPHKGEFSSPVHDDDDDVYLRL